MLLRERRTPARLAGVERRYGGLRVLVGLFRLLGATVVVVGLLMFVFGLGQAPPPVQLGVLLGSLVLGVVLLAAASVVHVVLDIEENTRASFRVQQQLLERLERVRADEA
jgi:RsiW-degrading membrane proteinase PrsW (M82 family)